MGDAGVCCGSCFFTLGTLREKLGSGAAVVNLASGEDSMCLFGNGHLKLPSGTKHPHGVAHAESPQRGSI